MLKHIFIAPAFADCTAEQLDNVIGILSEQPKLIAQIRDFSVAKNAGLSGEQPGVAMVAEFDNVADWQAYMGNADHAAQAKAIAPYIDLSKMVVTQFEV